MSCQANRVHLDCQRHLLPEPLPCSPNDGHLRRVEATLVACSLIPVAFIVARIALNLRNIPYADEFEVVLDYLVRLTASSRSADWWSSWFSVQNEHRMMTSRLLVTALHFGMGGIDFKLLAVIGNLFLFGACGLILHHVGSWRRRAVIGFVLACVVFQNQHYENFYWGGSSIDHFHVVFLAVFAGVALLERTRFAFAGAILLGALASFTLTHGFAIWIVGALLLITEKRWRRLVGWSASFLGAALIFAIGFRINPGHHVEVAWNLPRVLHYWLTLVGATAAVGHNRFSPWLAVVLLGSFGWLLRGGIAKREPLAAGLTLFCLLSLGLMAVGRVGIWGGPDSPLFSRYGILSALAWALVIWMALEETRHRGWLTWRLLAWTALPLLAFNLISNIRYIGWGADFADAREKSVARYLGKTTFTGARFPLFPDSSAADRIIHEAAEHGIYKLPKTAEHLELPRLRLIKPAAYFFDEVTTASGMLYLDGWAFPPQRKVRRGQLHVVLSSKDSLRIYRAVPIRRPDVANAYGLDDVLYSGFRLALPLSELSPDEYRLGILFKRGATAHYFMTDHMVSIPRNKQANAPRIH